MIASILSILAGIPKGLEIIKFFYNEIGDWLVARENEQRRKAVEDGIELAKKTKDTSKLEDAFK